MKKTRILAILLVLALAKLSAATVQAEAMLNNLGEFWRLGLRASYSEMVGDNASFAVSIFVPNHQYIRLAVDGKYVVKKIMPIFFGGVVEHKGETNRTGARAGLGIQTPSQNFHFHLETTVYPQITKSPNGVCWEILGQIGWARSNFDTYFQYRHKNMAGADGSMVHMDFVDFHVKMMSTVTSVYVMMDMSAFEDLRQLNPAGINVNASLQIGGVDPNNTEYFAAVGYNREVSTSDLPIFVSFGTKFSF